MKLDAISTQRRQTLALEDTGFQKQIDALQDELEYLQGIQEENERLLSRIKSIEDLESKLEDAETDIKKLKEDNQGLLETNEYFLTTVFPENDFLKKSLATLASEHECAKREISALNEELVKMQNDKESQHFVEELQKQLSDLRDKNVSIEQCLRNEKGEQERILAELQEMELLK